MEDRLAQATHALVARFRRQRPLRSGSLLITILGDAIAPRGGAVTLGSLIRLAEPFGLTERLVRTSVGRLAQDGWLVSRRVGRRSEYYLSSHGRRRFAEATQRIYSEGPRDWNGRWTMVFLPPGSPLRDEMLWLGFGYVTPGVLAHPSRSVADTRQQLRELGVKNHPIIVQAASDAATSDHRLIASGWNLADLARGYRRFAKSFSAIRDCLSSGVAASPPQAFLIRTLLIHEYRKIHLRDPLLPHTLLPLDWIGAHAYALCQELYRALFAAAEIHLSQCAERLNGKLGAPSRAAHARFGGIAPVPNARTLR